MSAHTTETKPIKKSTAVACFFSAILLAAINLLAAPQKAQAQGDATCGEAEVGGTVPQGCLTPQGSSHQHKGEFVTPQNNFCEAAVRVKRFILA